MQAVTYGSTGAKTVATATGEGVGIVPPAVSGDGVTIPWGSRDESGTDSPVLLTFAAIPLSYRLDQPEEIIRVDGYLDGILIRDLEDGHAAIPIPGPHSFTAVAHGVAGSILGVDRSDFSISGNGRIELDGGLLRIDETGGVACSASACTYTRTYTPGEHYFIVVGRDYRDTADVFLRAAEFRVDGPGGLKYERRLLDLPILNDSRQSEIVLWLEPEGPGTYDWTIFCSEGDQEATETGSLVLR